MVAVTREGDENSCVLEEIRLVVFESCLIRSRDVIFEGFSGEGLVMVVVEKRRRRRRSRKCREKLESLRARERMRS